MIRLSIFPNSLKSFGTFVSTAFLLYKWSFCNELNFCQKKWFFVLFGERAWKIRTSGDFFSALLSKLHFASPEDLSDVFSEQFLFFEPFRGLSSKCWKIRPKNFGTVFFKTAFFVYRRNFWAGISIWKKAFYTLCPFWNLIKKKSGVFTERIRRGCPNCLLRM